MPEEQLKAFLAKLQADTSLQEKLKAEGADTVAIARAIGFSITQEEIKACLRWACADSEEERELDLDELQSVAGGGFNSQHKDGEQLKNLSNPKSKAEVVELLKKVWSGGIKGHSGYGF